VKFADCSPVFTRHFSNFVARISLLSQSYDDSFLLWCHLFTVRCHFLTDDILTELQGISLNDVTGFILEHFGIE
jgi:hypothetical protein